LNVKRSPFDDVRVRRAVSFGIKYESLAKEIFDGIFETADGFYPNIFPFAVKNQKTDLAASEKLLDESGWEKGDDGIRRKNNNVLAIDLLTYPQQPDWVKLATAIQANLREIGFEVNIRQVDDINQALKTGDWNLGISSPGLTTNGGAPDPFLREFLTTKGAKNFGGISDAELDALVETLSRTFEQTKRNEILRRIQEIIIAEKVYEIRPVFSRSRTVVGQRFSAYEPSPRLHHVTFETKPD
jgi:peptide/nickel transport system substrate-binding protein